VLDKKNLTVAAQKPASNGLQEDRFYWPYTPTIKNQSPSKAELGQTFPIEARHGFSRNAEYVSRYIITRHLTSEGAPINLQNSFSILVLVGASKDKFCTLRAPNDPHVISWAAESAS
jgi:hypothetical protein